jgi:hypothetical protein
VRAAKTVVAAATLVALGACYPTSNICGERTRVMSDADGGEHRCVRAEDCPRPDDLAVCVTDAPQAPCVSCTDTRCTRHDPEPCQ